MAEIGDVVSLTFYTFNSSSEASNAGAVDCTITLPDGTTSTPTPDNTTTGVYVVKFTATQAGLHGVKWVATGDNASAAEDSFQVDATSAPAVSLSEVKAHLNMSGVDLDRDDELTQMVLAAQSAVEARVGPLTRRTVTETYSGGVPAIVLTAPVIGVSSVSESGTALDAADYSVSAGSGVLTRVSGYSRSTWTSGFNNIAVTYTVGLAFIPPDLRQAVLELVRHLWTTQRGQMSGRRGGDEFVAGQGYSLPNRVLELLAPYELPGIA